MNHRENSTGKALYSIKNLRYAFPEGSEVLNIPSLEIQEGRVAIFLGANGAGKTTLLRILNGLLPASEGTVLLGGLPLSEHLRELRNLSVYIHQNPMLLSGTVFSNVAYGLSVRQVPRAEIRRRVAEALETVGLGGYEGRGSRRLSGGEVQRVALARALVLKPRVFLMDEPTANIDGKTTVLLESLVRKMTAEKGVTVLISTHDIPFAYRIADSVVRMENGRISPEEENIFKGRIMSRTESGGIFETQGLSINCPAGEGEFTTLVLRCDDILLSDEPIHTSARNHLQGKVSSIEKAGPLYYVTIDAGIRLRAHVTESSVREFDLRPGREIHAAFKSSAVRLY
jgi:molybdate/tungstate transport system ATP-binding protein